MERHFIESQRDLEKRLLTMAHHVEMAVEAAMHSLLTRNNSKLAEVYELETQINRDQKEVDEACVKQLALHQPLAMDLRLIVSIIKINSDLERMGDQAVNIAGSAQRYLAAETIKPLIDLPRMFEEVQFMVRDALTAFIRRDADMARSVLIRDDNVDQLNQKIFQEMLVLLQKTPEKMQQGLSLIFIARNLEKIGDHATNIAEDTIYVVSGEDIRHPIRK